MYQENETQLHTTPEGDAVFLQQWTEQIMVGPTYIDLKILITIIRKTDGSEKVTDVKLVT